MFVQKAKLRERSEKTIEATHLKPEESLVEAKGAGFDSLDFVIRGTIV